MEKLIYKTLRQEVVQTLRMKILNGELKPGERLVEQELSDALGVSRGPIRESLRQMEQEGLVEYTRNIGCSVKQFSDLDTFEVYLIRGTLEILAAKLCNGCLSSESEAKMKEILCKMQDVEDEDFFNNSIKYDNEFHDIVVSQSGMKRLHDIWSSMSPTNLVIFYAENADKGTAATRQYDIHKVLLDAYMTKDIKIISSALMEHYLLTTRRRLKETGCDEADFPYNIAFKF